MSSFWTAVLRWAMPESQRDAALGDLAEEFQRRLAEDGEGPARRWLRRQAIRSVAPALRHKVGVWRDEWLVDDEGEGATMWWKDLYVALRVLMKRPGFTATVVVTLALGIGATTAVFGVFRGVFLEPLPYPEPDELVVVMQTASFGCCGPASGPDYLDWVERERSFDGLAALNPGTLTLTGLEEPERVYGLRVTASAFDILGVAPLLGRALLEEDANGAEVVVLSHDLWSRLFAARRDVVGESLEVDGRSRVIIGVMPEGFDVPSPWQGTLRHQLYMPIPAATLTNNRGSHGLPVIGRLSDGVRLESAQSDMERIMRELGEEYPRTNADRSAQVFTVHDYLYGRYAGQLGLILGASALVLLIACGNVAGLQLARAAARDTELAVRSALGASRRAMVRLLFSESLLLAVLGGALGVAFAYLSIDALKALLPPSMPRVDQVTMDGSALGVALVAAAFTALAFGMIPALFASRTDVASRVREGGYGTLAPGKERLRDAFIVGQIALGLVLANGAGLLVRSYAAVRGQEYGFETEGVLTLSLSPTGPRYPDAASVERYYDQVMERVSEIPGVETLGLVTRLPLHGGSNGSVQVEGWEPRSSADEGPLVEVVSVVGDYFDAMGIPLLRGRTLVADDSIPDAVGVVINQAMADEVWPGEDPIGKRFGFGEPPPWLTVVGVVGNVRQWGPEQDVLAQAYFPLSRGWSTWGYLTVRLVGDPTEIVPEIRSAALAIDPTQPPTNIRGMDERLERRLAQRRFYTTLIAIFALAALFLASAGVYGTVSYYVARRTRELGIRMALGAAGTGIVGLVVRRGVRLAVWGVGVGLVGVWASVRVVSSLVYGVEAVDPGTIALGGLTLGAVAVLASVLPALRAVRVHPVRALRSE